MVKAVNVVKNGTIVQNTAFVCYLDVTQIIQSSLTITVCVQHTGGTISVTLKWSPDGKSFVTQAAAAVGDVANITTGNVAWDNFVLPGIPQTVEITVTEENAAACTDLDITVLGY